MANAPKLRASARAGVGPVTSVTPATSAAMIAIDLALLARATKSLVMMMSPFRTALKGDAR
jgi:hypothetical protein